MDKFGIYIHIPFCKKKCKYCDFISFSCAEENYDNYFECLIKEIQNSNYKNKKITTIYIGGGTPSLVDSKYIGLILDTLKNNFNIDENAEVTIEVNPGSADEKKLKDYINFGINRLSIGLQSSSDRLLNLIGRIHNYNEFLNTYETAKKVGFKNINVDLMLAIPTQTEEELLESVKNVISLNPNHISVYSLILEEGTELEKQVSSGILKLLDEDIERKMYWKTKKILEKNGYKHYEISNFAKKGFESKHNLDCWNQEEYLGVGLAAHSYINNKRFSNTNNFEEYVKNIKQENYEKNVQIHEVQEREEKAKEYMMLGLRKIEGISISEFERKFRINPLFYFRFEIEKLTNEELIEVDLDKIKLTKKGLDLANLVFEEFI
jgi:oxygen-independent coproporphyrinogen-3 oxidase